MSISFTRRINHFYSNLNDNEINYRKEKKKKNPKYICYSVKKKEEEVDLFWFSFIVNKADQ
jgi:hypothetical protein